MSSILLFRCRIFIFDECHCSHVLSSTDYPLYIQKNGSQVKSLTKCHLFYYSLFFQLTPLLPLTILTWTLRWEGRALTAYFSAERGFLNKIERSSRLWWDFSGGGFNHNLEQSSWLWWAFREGGCHHNLEQNSRYSEGFRQGILPTQSQEKLSIVVGSEKRLSRTSAASLVLWVRTGGMVIIGMVRSLKMVMTETMGSFSLNSIIPLLLLLSSWEDNRLSGMDVRGYEALLSSIYILYSRYIFKYLLLQQS